MLRFELFSSFTQYLTFWILVALIVNRGNIDLKLIF